MRLTKSISTGPTTDSATYAPQIDRKTVPTLLRGHLKSNLAMESLTIGPWYGIGAIQGETVRWYVTSNTKWKAGKLPVKWSRCDPAESGLSITPSSTAGKVPAATFSPNALNRLSSGTVKPNAEDCTRNALKSLRDFPSRSTSRFAAPLVMPWLGAQPVAIYSRIALCSYWHSASWCLTTSRIDTRPTSLLLQMTGRWRNRPLVIFSMAT